MLDTQELVTVRCGQVHYPGDFANGFDIMLDTEELATVRWEQAEPSR